MNAGLLALANNQGTSNPLLKAYLIARRINTYIGGGVIAPWEVDQLPEEWLDAINGLTIELPGMAKGYQQINEYLEKWRAQWRND